MKIHSSSLTFSPAGLNRYNIDTKTSKEEKNEQPIDKQIQPSSSKEIKQALTEADLKKTILAPDNQPTNNKTLKALNAYIQELNQPLQDRTAQLITGIDTYA